jgi:hypothetical protein
MIRASKKTDVPALAMLEFSKRSMHVACVAEKLRWCVITTT